MFLINVKFWFWLDLRTGFYKWVINLRQNNILENQILLCFAWNSKF